MDNSSFADYKDVCVSHTFILTFSHSLFSSHSLGSGCKDSKLFMPEDVCLCVFVCVCGLNFRACMCIAFICIIDLAVYTGTKQCPAPSAQFDRETMTSVLTLSFLPSCLDYNGGLTMRLFVGQCHVLLPSISPQADCHEF